MTRAMLSLTGKGWIALYRDRNGRWRAVSDARRWPVYCATKELALSVADYRRRRLEIWRDHATA